MIPFQKAVIPGNDGEDEVILEIEPNDTDIFVMQFDEVLVLNRDHATGIWPLLKRFAETGKLTED